MCYFSSMPRKGNKVHTGAVLLDGLSYSYSLDRNGVVEVHRHAETILTFNVWFNDIPGVKNEVIARLRTKLNGTQLHMHKIVKVPYTYTEPADDYNQDIYPD